MTNISNYSYLEVILFCNYTKTKSKYPCGKKDDNCGIVVVGVVGSMCRFKVVVNDDKYCFYK